MGRRATERLSRVFCVGVVAAVAAGCGAATTDQESTPAEDPRGAPAAASTDERAVVQVSEAVLAALSDGDVATLRELMHPSARLLALGDDPAAEPRVSTLEQFLTSIGSSEVDLLERMWEPTVLVQGRLATVWTPYDFFRDGTFSHCGIDVFTLGKFAERWRVTSIAYTVEREGCEASPLGPPT